VYILGQDVVPGVHRYTLRQFDLDPAAESRRYAAYRERFHIPVEESA
jgi:hypothetical protein